MFKLHGLLPANVQTLEEQVKRAYAQYSSRSDDLAKNTFMTSMKEQNEVLYYRVGASPLSTCAVTDSWFSLFSTTLKRCSLLSTPLPKATP